MKTTIVFYSFSGNTQRACLFLKEKLGSQGIPADEIQLRPKKEAASFFGQCWQAALRRTPELVECNCDVRGYDVVIFSSPVWAFTIAPALRAYLKRIKNCEDKKVVCFLTFGSGTGSSKALKELEEILRKKRAYILFSENLAGRKTKDDSYLKESFKALLKALKL